MKEIEQMNIEELRNALKESENARIEAEKTAEKAKTSAESMKTLWEMAEKENKVMKDKLQAVKALAGLL